MLNIAVCIKQVPASDTVAMDAQKGVLLREGHAARINPYDLVAIEAALRLKELCGGQVTSFTMGPNSARDVLSTSFSMGADAGVLLCDARFAGADVYASSYTLAKGIQRTGSFDAVICGRQTTDGDTGQVGPSLAEHLNMVHVYNICGIESIEETHITVAQKVGHDLVTVRVCLPCMLVIAKDAFSPRLPSLRLKLEAKKKRINVLTFDDLGEPDEQRFGLKGSPTQVEKIYPPPQAEREQVLCGEPSALADAVIERLQTRKLLTR